MRQLYTLLLLTFSAIVLAQAPQKMSYQAVIRDAANNLVINTDISMRVSILKTTTTGTSVYVETHAISTNFNGLATLQIGTGTVVSGVFADIDWAHGPYFIKTETNPNGGTNYTIISTTQLLSVPYALLAEKTTKPTYPVSASGDSNTFLASTIRNVWVDDPNIEVIVPETGKYLLTFYASASNGNHTFTSDPSTYDSDGIVRVYNSSSDTELVTAITLRWFTDFYSPLDGRTLLLSMRPSRSMMLNLTGGDFLKLQYMQQALGNPLPATTWFIRDGGISLLKIGE